MRRSKGYRSKARGILKKKPKERGVKPLGYLLTNYEVGDKVLISIDSAAHKGQPHRRYHGKYGVITEKRGHAYVVAVKSGNKTKSIIAIPQHLKSFPT